MSVTTQGDTKTYQPFLLPTYEDIKNFMEHGRSDEVDIRSQLGMGGTSGAAHEEERAFKSTPSPPPHRDLVEILTDN